MPRQRTHRLAYTTPHHTGPIRTDGGITTLTRDGKPFLRIDFATGQITCWPDGPDHPTATLATFLPDYWTGSDYRPATATDGDCDRCHKPFTLTDDVVEMTPGDPKAACLVHRDCWTELLTTRPQHPRKPIHIQPHVEVLTTANIDGDLDTAVVIDGRHIDTLTHVTLNPDYGDRRLLSDWHAEAERHTTNTTPAFTDLVLAAYDHAEPHCTVNNLNTATNPQPGVTNLGDLNPTTWITPGTTLHPRLTHPWTPNPTHDVNAARRTDNTTRATWALHAVKAVSVALRDTRTNPDHIPTKADWHTAADIALDTYAAVATDPTHKDGFLATLTHLLEATNHLCDALGYGQRDTNTDPLTAPPSWHGITNLFSALLAAANGPWKETLLVDCGTTYDAVLDEAQAEYDGNIALYPGPHDH